MNYAVTTTSKIVLVSRTVPWIRKSGEKIDKRRGRNSQGLVKY
jgi:hypothetical protein